MSRRMIMMEALKEMGRINIGQESPVNILNLFNALENGTAKTGEFSLNDYLPSGETLVISTGLSEIKGLMVVDADWEEGARNNDFTSFAIWLIESDVYVVVGNGRDYNSNIGVSNSIGFVRGSVRIDGGDVYCTPQFGSEASYTPFQKGHRIVWVAW